MENMRTTSSKKTIKLHQCNGKAHKTHICLRLDTLRQQYDTYCIWPIKSKCFRQRKILHGWFSRGRGREGECIFAQQNQQKLNMLGNGESPCDVMSFFYS